MSRWRTVRISFFFFFFFLLVRNPTLPLKPIPRHPPPATYPTPTPKPGGQSEY